VKPQKENKDFSKWPSIKNASPAKSTPVKYDPHMGLFAPMVKEAKRRQSKDNRRIG
jgi:hypothetical protein